MSCITLSYENLCRFRASNLSTAEAKKAYLACLALQHRSQEVTSDSSDVATLCESVLPSCTSSATRYWLLHSCAAPRAWESSAQSPVQQKQKILAAAVRSALNKQSDVIAKVSYCFYTCTSRCSLDYVMNVGARRQCSSPQR
jgi:hypothetical protein